MPTFTVLVPTYNQAEYLPEALASLQAQTCPDWEAVVVNDGSTDATRAVLDGFAAQDPRIRAFHKANGGVSTALNEALRHARGAWICWLSSDDLLEPHALATFAGAMAASPEARFFHSDFHELVHETGERRPGPPGRAGTLPPKELQTLAFFLGNYIHGISLCIAKSLFDEVGPFNPDLRYAQDMDMWLRMSALAELRYIDRRTCVTRVHRQQGTFGFPEAGGLDSARACLDFLNAHPFEALVPHLDLATAEGITRAVRETLTVALNTWACMYSGVGPVPAMLERLGEWLGGRCPEPYRAPIREGLLALEGKLGTLPAPLGSALHRVALGEGIRYTPKDALASMKAQWAALEEAGDRVQAPLLARYLDKVAGVSLDRAAPVPEAFLLEPDFGGEAWLEALLAFLEAFAPGEPVALLILLDPSRDPAPPAAEVEAAVLEMASRMGCEAFADVAVVARPEDLLEALRPYPRVHRLPLPPAGSGLDTAARRRLAERLQGGPRDGAPQAPAAPVALPPPQARLEVRFSTEGNLDAEAQAQACLAHLRAALQQRADLAPAAGIRSWEVLDPARPSPSVRPEPRPRAPGDAFSICFVGTCYSAFLEHHYRTHPGFLQLGYQAQLDELLQTGFGDADFYSRGMSKAGWRAVDLVANCVPLQTAWAREHGFEGDLAAILVEQVRRFQPDVVYLQDLSLANRELLPRLRPHTRLIVGQIASPVPDATHLQGLDILMSSFPHFVERFRAAGVCSYHQPLAFDPRILDRLGPRHPALPFTFIGGISAHHAKGTELLAEVAAATPLEVWGYGAEHLPAGSLLRQRHHGEAWGLDMFRLLQSSRITLNRHIDTAERFANNMRLFESTGAGALLVTDHKDNLGDLFRIGEEIVAFRSPEECVDLVNYYLGHPEEAEAIARAGQARTLRDHTYDRRMAHSAELFERHLRQPETRRRFGNADLARVSTGYEVLPESGILPAHTEAWKDPAIPARQRALVEQQLEELYRGEVNPVFQVLADLLEPVVPADGSLLEIGCSSGYYYEILGYLLNRRLDYVGVDYSGAFIEMARGMYPRARFEVADGAALPFPDDAFPCVVSSCILLHTPNFRDHVRETARVAGAYVVAHRTPVCRTRPTQVQRKLAYGVETVELRFNEAEFLQAFLDEGLLLDRTLVFGSRPGLDEYEVSYRFRFPGAPRPELLP